MEQEIEQEHDKPLPGWACIAIGVAFIVGLATALFVVRMLAS